MNPFFNVLPPPGGPPPERVYATLDQVETIDDEAGTTVSLLFGGFDAIWYESPTGRAVPPEAFFHALPLVVLQISVSLSDPASSDSELLYSIASDPNAEDDTSRWFEFTLSTGNSLPIDVYRGLFAEPIKAGLQSVYAVPQTIARQLSRRFSLDDVPDASRDDLDRCLARIGPIGFAAVYDVGQGNCNALCDPAGSVSAYFDFGGGALQNTRTFPAQLKSFCFRRQPPIVLSHWDWDHWSSSCRDRAALARTWLVPRQEVGAVHRVFAAEVQQLGRLLVWPSGLSAMTVGQVSIEHCTGEGRNHGGLALILHEREDGTGQHMLFTGDARYTVIPSHDRLTYTSVVVPHHGADMRNQYAPPCLQRSHCRLAYSYGEGNSFGHPKAITRRIHDLSGWADPMVFNPISPPVPRRVRETASRSAHGCPRHIALPWSPRPLPSLPCQGERCQLTLDAAP